MLFCISPIALYAQCDEKLQKQTLKDVQAGYQLEIQSNRPYTSFADGTRTITATFVAYAMDKYRVMNLCNGFSEPVEFVVKDVDDEVLYSSVEQPQNRTFDFTATKNGIYKVVFKVARLHNPQGCIAYAVGYKTK